MTVVGSGADCRHKASLSCYEGRDTEAQRGAETCPRARSRADAQLASPCAMGLAQAELEPSYCATLDKALPCSFPWLSLEEMTCWHGSLPTFGKCLLQS